MKYTFRTLAVISLVVLFSLASATRADSEPAYPESANTSQYIGNSFSGCEYTGAHDVEFIICDTPVAQLHLYTHSHKVEVVVVVVVVDDETGDEPDNKVTVTEPPVSPPVEVKEVETKPGHGYGDKNHEHTGPPGQEDKAKKGKVK